MKPSMRLHHCAISVKDMAESIAFYRDIFGFEVDTQIEVNEDFQITHMKLDDSYIELFWVRGATELPEHARSLEADLAVIGTKHMAFATDDVAGMYRYLASKGVELLGEVRADNPDYQYFFFKDINGVLMEFVSRKP